MIDEALASLAPAISAGVPATFEPRGYCLLWDPGLVWLHAISDAFIALAYFSIPFALVVMVLRRRDLEFGWMFHMFAGFIIACGATHLMGIWTLWNPNYLAEGVLKLGTAGISVATAIMLWTIIPRVLALPSPGRLAQANVELEREVAERRQTERELREAQKQLEHLVTSLAEKETQLRLIADALPVLIAYVNADLRYEFANRTLLNWQKKKRHEVIGCHLSEVLGDQNFERIQGNIDQTLAGGDQRYSSVIDYADGVTREVEVVNISHKDENGKVVGFYALVTDISEQKRIEAELSRNVEAAARANEELERSNRELDEFAYVASHDLKEPLRGISHYAAFLIEDYKDVLDKDGRTRLASIQRLSKRMDTLIESLHEYSRVGRTRLAVVSSDLGKVVEGVLDSLHVMIGENAVDVRIPKPLPRVVCDRVRIGEVFRNLITNAVKYNDKQEKWLEVGYRDHIESGASQQSEMADGIDFYVKDNGIGIADKHKESVFRIFRRLHRRDQYGGGTGAGLSIVEKIVQRHGGRIWFKSNQGEGTTFWFTISSKTEPA